MSPCPSVAELAALLVESPDAPGRPDLEAHLGGCAACQSALLGLADETRDWGRWQRLLRSDSRSPDEALPGPAPGPRPETPADLEPPPDVLSGWKNTLRVRRPQGA